MNSAAGSQAWTCVRCSSLRGCKSAFSFSYSLGYRGESKYWCTFCFPLSLGPSGAAEASGEQTTWKKLWSIRRCCPSPPSTWLAYTKLPAAPSPPFPHLVLLTKFFFSLLPLLLNSSVAYVSCPCCPSHTRWIMNRRHGTTEALLLHTAFCPPSGMIRLLNKCLFIYLFFIFNLNRTIIACIFLVHRLQGLGHIFVGFLQATCTFLHSPCYCLGLPYSPYVGYRRQTSGGKKMSYSVLSVVEK